MDKQVALVTGGGRGLGLTIAQALAEAGYAVAVLDVAPERLPGAVAALKRHGSDAAGYAADITQPGEVDTVLRQIESSWGVVTSLVNNAAFAVGQEPARAEQIAFELWRKQIDVNVNGTFLMSQRVGRELIKRGLPGAIVNISSIYGMRAVDWRLYSTGAEERFDEAQYHVSKAAIDQMTRSLAVSWARFKIRVNSVNPGPIDNEGTRESLPQDVLDKIASRVPMGRLAQEAEIAKAVLFLLSGSASYITGANLVVDGGWTSW